MGNSKRAIFVLSQKSLQSACLLSFSISFLGSCIIWLSSPTEEPRLFAHKQLFMSSSKWGPVWEPKELALFGELSQMIWITEESCDSHHHFGFNSALLHLCPTTKKWWTWTCRILTLTPFHVVIIFYSLVFKLLCMEQPLLWTGFRGNRVTLKEQFTVGSINFYLLFF